MILLAEHAEPNLAAKKMRQIGTLKKPTSSPKNRVWGFENHPSGRIAKKLRLSPETAMGSVQFSYKTASGQEEHYEYDPFGNLVNSTGTLQQSYQWSSKEVDSGTGLVYYGYRFYSPTTGRWTNRDPLGEDGGLNVLQFVLNNPIGEFDALGQTFTEIVHKVTLADIRSVPGQEIWFASTATGRAPEIIGDDRIVEKTQGKQGCCYCAKVVEPKQINLVAESWIPTDGVGKEFTDRGRVDVWHHEARRRAAMRIGYYHYLDPATDSLAKRCGWVCRSQPGEARAALQSYLEKLRNIAITNYVNYNNAMQARISDENSHWLPNNWPTQPVDYYNIENYPLPPPPWNPPVPDCPNGCSKCSGKCK